MAKFVSYNIHFTDTLPWLKKVFHPSKYGWLANMFTYICIVCAISHMHTCTHIYTCIRVVVVFVVFCVFFNR